MMKYVLLLVLILTVTSCGLFSTASKAVNAFETMSMSTAKELMERDDFSYTLLDVRTKEEYREGHIPGALNLPNETIDEGVIEKLPSKEETILVYCRSGNRSRQAAMKLANLGYTHVIDIGGIRSWNGPIER